MDKTQVFKAAVMTVKVQKKGELDSKNRILPKSAHNAQRDEFSKQAKDVLNKITNLRNILIENRAAYMRIGQHLKSAAQMTDEQRDLIDRESEKFFIYYTQHLGQMRADWKRAKRKPQQREHIEAVIELLTNYLRSVHQIHLDQKKYRIQYELELHRLLKLASDKKEIPVRLGGLSKQVVKSRQNFSDEDPEDDDDDADAESEATSEMDLDDSWLDDDDDDDDNNKSRDNGDDDDDERDGRKKTKHKNDLNTSKPSSSELNKSQAQAAIEEDIQKSEELVQDEVTKLSPEDIQMFEEENVQLYHELQGLSEEVEQIEKNVVDIAQLQDIFTEKVSMQQHNIDRIANAVVGATENVKDANEQIKQAIQRNAGLRVWSLFFLLVMSFALLFLDWYYD